MKQITRNGWARGLALGGVLLGGLAVAVLLARSAGNAGPSDPRQLLEGAPPAVDAATETKIRAFCGDCHAVPRPESFQRDMWHDEVEKGYQFYARSGRADLDPPPMAQTVAWYRARAPEQLDYPKPVEAAKPLAVTFRAERLNFDPSIRTPPSIAGLRWLPLQKGEPAKLVASDMLCGEILGYDFSSQKLRRLALLNHPCRIVPCDLDEDGYMDLLVSDLGSFKAVDHDRGRVVWLRQSPVRGGFEEVVLASGLGRVCDARPIRTVPQGPIDIVVAEFGWYRTGRTLLLKNVAEKGARPRFEPKEIDSRTGPVDVPVGDLDGDGRTDFLALVSNEHESVEAFLNQGDNKFHRRTLWRAPDLTYGSNGLDLLDLNGDGRPDILYVNGDAFDNDYLSPWHGVQWLENRGKLEFTYHRIVDLPGACAVRAVDLDGDGDLDLVVTAFLPRDLKPKTFDTKSTASLIVLEQVSPGRFVCHTLERGLPCHAAVEVGDFNGDGRPDIAVGTNNMGAESDSLGRTWVTIWWNQGKAASR